MKYLFAEIEEQENEMIERMRKLLRSFHFTLSHLVKGFREIFWMEKVKEDTMQKHLSPEQAAPILGMSAAKIRKYMRDKTLDIGLAIPPEKTGKKTWEFRIYPAKLCRITGDDPEHMGEA